MAHAAVVQKRNAQFAGFAPVFNHIESQQRGELFLAERILGTNALFVGNQQTGALRHFDASDTRDAQSVAAHDGGVHAAVAAFHNLLDLGELVAREEVAALGFHGGAHLVGNAGIRNDGLLRSADGAVIEGFAAHDLGHGVFNIGGTFDVGRHVASAHAQSGRAGAVSCLDHAGAASGQDKVADLHELIGAFDGRHADAAHEIGGHMAGTQGALDGLHSFGDAVAGAGVRGKHNGIARLERDKRFIDNRGRGIGGRHDAGNDAHGHGDFHNLADRVGMQLADGLHVLDAGIDLFAGKQVLDLFILGLAEAGFLNSHIGQGFSLGRSGFRHCPDNLVHAVLTQLREFGLSFTRRTHKCAGLLNGE